MDHIVYGEIRSIELDETYRTSCVQNFQHTLLTIHVNLLNINDVIFARVKVSPGPWIPGGHVVTRVWCVQARGIIYFSAYYFGNFILFQHFPVRFLTCFRYESSIVGSYFSTKMPCTNCTVNADFPTPPIPRTTILYSRILKSFSGNCLLKYIKIDCKTYCNRLYY